MDTKPCQAAPSPFINDLRIHRDLHLGSSALEPGNSSSLYRVYEEEEYTQGIRCELFVSFLLRTCFVLLKANHL